jgi:CRISPR-associated exonuclease Cas4
MSLRFGRKGGSMDKQITGVMIYYYYVCKRKLWYFYNEIQMEQGNENVSLGTLLDENSYKREEKHINIDNVINIDFLRMEGVLHEVKKSDKIEDASIWQVKYYLYYLKQHDVLIRAKIDYPLLRRTIDVELLSEDITILENTLREIKDITRSAKPTEFKKCGICKSCAYHDLCFI